MDKLIEALTRLAVIAGAYLEQRLNTEAGATTAVPSPAVAPEPAKPAKTRKLKGEPAPEIAPEPAPAPDPMLAPAPAPAVDAKAVEQEMYATTQVFMERFKVAKPTGRERLTAKLGELKVASLAELPLEARVKWTHDLKKELAAA